MNDLIKISILFLLLGKRFDDVSDQKKEVDIATARAYYIMNKVADYLNVPVKKYGNYLQILLMYIHIYN